jgi:hypothetical protein
MKELISIQTELKAPKSQRNDFGKYNYRSCEDILEATKPLLIKYECFINITDEIQLIGDRYYVKAVATLTNKEGVKVSSIAYAREEEAKKGMDASQITGAASSYARKYALNGLLAIDDTKDADTTNKHEDKGKPALSPEGFNRVMARLQESGEIEKAKSYLSKFQLSNEQNAQFNNVLGGLNAVA